MSSPEPPPNFRVISEVFLVVIGAAFFINGLSGQVHLPPRVNLLGLVVCVGLFLFIIVKGGQAKRIVGVVSVLAAITVLLFTLYPGGHSSTGLASSETASPTVSVTSPQPTLTFSASTPNPTPTPPTSQPPPATSGPSSPPYPETAGGEAHTWTNYTNAGGNEGPTVAADQTIGMGCRLTGFQVQDGNTWWYRIAQSPWSNIYYVSADAFYNNGQTSGSLHNTPPFDPTVPLC